MAHRPVPSGAHEAARKPKMRPGAMVIGVLLALFGLAGVVVPAILSYAPYHWDEALLRLGIGSVLLFTVYGVCLMMVGAAVIVGAFRRRRSG